MIHGGSTAEREIKVGHDGNQVNDDRRRKTITFIQQMGPFFLLLPIFEYILSLLLETE
jgi:hypothetical protein